MGIMSAVDISCIVEVIHKKVTTRARLKGPERRSAEFMLLLIAGMMVVAIVGRSA